MFRQLLLLIALTVFAAGMAQPRLTVLTDKQCYLAGERVCVRVDLPSAQPSGVPAESIAYVELSDTQQMVAQAMVSLKKGQGWAELPLPVRLHSGAYQLTAYTRSMRSLGEATFSRSFIGVINGEQLSRRDNVCFVADSLFEPGPSPISLPSVSCRPLSEVTLSLPDSLCGGCAITVEQNAIRSNIPVSLKESGSSPATKQFAPEFEGHIVEARPLLEGSVIASTRLALVGKTASVYDGQAQPDGSYLYYTVGITGNLPALVNAYTSDGVAIPMQIVSPYAQALPASLPELQVCCTESDIIERASAARKQAAVSEWLKSDTLAHSMGFMSATPHYFYDLDEYTHMSTIRELLVEFVRGVHRDKEQGVSMLFTFDPDSRRYSRWPALVLLDGMPVYDIDEILDYDAHLVKYVQIYTERFTFGQSCCQGVISFITRGGRLSNYKLDTGSRLVSYAFPQDHPVFVPHTTQCPPSGCPHSTLQWYPAVAGSEYTFRAPAAPGRYLITLQGYKPDGTRVLEQKELTVVPQPAF